MVLLSDVPSDRVPVLVNQNLDCVRPVNMLQMFVPDNNDHLSAEMRERATRHLITPAAGDTVGAGGWVLGPLTIHQNHWPNNGL